MKKIYLFALTAIVTIVCSLTVVTSFDPKQDVLNAYATVAGFNVQLSGSEKVPPVDTKATGSAEFTAPHFDNIGYKVNVSNIDKVTAAHIHSSKTGENGPIVVTLFKTESPSLESMNGILTSGNITNADLEGPMAGKTLIDLNKVMELGETYVNVHTEEHPNGEIRGQIKGGG
ncbi:MAG: CHRD domain-containing protein [Nitrososphaeraceae archaeon]